VRKLSLEYMFLMMSFPCSIDDRRFGRNVWHKVVVLLVVASMSALFLFVGTACASSRASSVEGEASHKKTDQSFRSVKIPVFYVTDREAEKHNQLYYSNQRSDHLDYGSVNVLVTIPKAQRQSTSKAAEPVNWTDEHNDVGDRPEVENAERVESAEKFYEAVEKARQVAPNKQILVYVHGYSMDFDKPLRTAGLLAYNLQMPVVAFSWPSKHNALAYSADECNAEWSTMDFESVLQELSHRFGRENITVVGHSLGCRIVTWAVKSISDKSRQSSEQLFQHIFFFSPDIDTQTFRRYSDYIEHAAYDVKIFVSAKDVRLGVSHILHGYSRLGRPSSSKRDNLFAIHGIETIDFTAIDKGVGHNIPYPLLNEIMSHSSEPFGIEVVRREPGLDNLHTDLIKVVKAHAHTQL
jgi:esterase/lipase superfamily enzyme